MPEVSNDHAPTTEARRGSDHGISIVTVHLPAGNPLRAECLCGWQSEIVPSRPKAAAAGQQHVAEISYASNVAERIADTIRSDDPLTVDQVGAIAETLGCAASSLLPSHLPLPTRESHCSCGRPAREVLDGGQFGPSGYCGSPAQPLDPCDCGRGAELHDRSVCHVYGRGMAAIGGIPESGKFGGSAESASGGSAITAGGTTGDITQSGIGGAGDSSITESGNTESRKSRTTSTNPATHGMPVSRPSVDPDSDDFVGRRPHWVTDAQWARIRERMDAMYAEIVAAAPEVAR